MTSNLINISIGGEAGQGLVTVGNLLSKALVRHGYKIIVSQGYQSRIRGGHNTFSIDVSHEEIFAPKESVDISVELNLKKIKFHEQELVPPYTELASVKYENTVALGIVAHILGLNKDVIANVVRDGLKKKEESVISENLLAIDKAYTWTAKQRIEFQKLPTISNITKRLMLNGNDAIALGAMSAGVKFCAFYPMTPATSISLTLAANATKLGITVEQAEDEIAAINMAIGASFAGAPSMVATAGGGFALMVEGVSLAGMTETPVVIVVGQRPAPATGLPTRTEQADLEFVLHSGHGEFPRAIFTPGDIEECFHLTRKAFEVAEAAQGPVFILTDQFLADSDRAAMPFDIEELAPVNVGADIDLVKLPYKRFAITPDGVSPRLLPGASEHLVIADSDEHTEDGHLTEDLDVRKLMVEKRLRKSDLLKEEIIHPKYDGEDNPELLFVSWGSTKGSVTQAAAQMKNEGKNVATLHFPQVWPMVPESFLHYLTDAKNVICVEGNATAQLARLICRETGFEITNKILRYDGLPITPEYILRNLKW